MLCFCKSNEISLCFQSPPLCFHYDVMEFQIVIMTRERVIIYNLKIHYIRNENREEEIILNNLELIICNQHAINIEQFMLSLIYINVIQTFNTKIS